jgi:uncharacterized protein YdcH (DUF465 family)
MTGFDKILERLNQLEDRMQDLEDAYPECDCEEVCEECDA